MSVTPALWHFTCDHGHAGIGKRGVLRPHAHPLLPALDAMVWLTCDGRPDRDDVGLTSRFLRCDRMAYRYRARPTSPVPWPDVADRIDPQVRADLESYSDPATWWLSFEPVPAVLS